MKAKTVMRKMLALLIVLMMTVSVVFIKDFGIIAHALDYNADAAIAYAAAHAKDTPSIPRNDCANFVSKCVTAGGIPVSQTTCINLKNALEPYATIVTKLETVSYGNGSSRRVPTGGSNATILSKGDVMFVCCSRCKATGNNYERHAVIYSGDSDNDGYAKCYAHTSMRNNETFYVGYDGITACDNGHETKYLEAEVVHFGAYSTTPPTAPTVVPEKKEYTVGDSIKLNYNAPGATSLHLYIYKDGEKWFEGEFSTFGSFSKECYVAGHYAFCVVGHYPGMDLYSTWDDFNVYETTNPSLPLTAPTVIPMKKEIAVGDSIQLNYDAPGATSLHLYIYKDGEKWFEGEFSTSGSFSRACYATGHYAFCVVGHYSGTDFSSSWDDCDVYDRSTLIPNKPDLWLDQYTIAVDQEFTIYHWAEKSKWYSMSIYKDGQSVFFVQEYTSTHQIYFTEPGNYKIVCSAINDYGDSEYAEAYFVIYNCVPSMPSIAITPYSPNANDTVTISLSPSTYSEDAFMTIRNQTTGEILVGPGLQLGVNCLNYDYSFTKTGNYVIEYATANCFGSSPVAVLNLIVICNHNWQDPVVNKKATCTEEGIMSCQCIDCGETKEDIIEKTPHSDNNGDGTCDECGTVFEVSQHDPNCVCGQYHTGSFAKFIIFFHRIIDLFRNQFKFA